MKITSRTTISEAGLKTLMDEYENTILDQEITILEQAELINQLHLQLAKFILLLAMP